MTKNKQIEIKLFGLTHEGGGDVRADVFAKKLDTLIRALRAADRQVNGEKTFNYFIRDLQYGSTYAAIAEEPYSTNRPPKGSSVQLFQSVVTSIRDGHGIPGKTNQAIVAAIASFGDGSDKTFSHGEIGIKGQEDTVVRVDKYFVRRADRALKDFRSSDNGVSMFDGVAFGTFDGTLKEVDLRGTVARAKLILNVGQIEIDCTCNSVTVDNLRATLDRRVTVSALAHYNGKDRLPEQLEIKRIDPIGATGSLQKWLGKFELPYPSAEDIW